MSHMTEIKTRITDLDALEAACVELGMKLVRGKTEAKWYGRSVGDYPLPEGMTADQLGKCDHAITLPGCEYEIGVYADKVKGGYRVLYDFWGPGMKLKEKIGENGGKLVQAYGVAKATREARRKGLTVQRVQGANGTVKLVIAGMR